jgi:hypothetical protein
VEEEVVFTLSTGISSGRVSNTIVHFSVSQTETRSGVLVEAFETTHTCILGRVELQTVVTLVLGASPTRKEVTFKTFEADILVEDILGTVIDTVLLAVVHIVQVLGWSAFGASIHVRVAFSAFGSIGNAFEESLI